MKDDPAAPRRTARTRPDTGPRSDQYCFPATPLSGDHFRVYEAARSHLKALAMSTPATSQVDYWEVLQRVDSLHEPLARMAAQPVATTTRGESYSAARAAIKGLARYGLDTYGVVAAVTALDECWEADTNRGHTAPAAGGAR